MKNYYLILNVNNNISSKDLKNHTINLINNLKDSNISINEKKKKLLEINEAYKFLNDYHSREQLDNFLLNDNKFINFNNLFNNNKLFDSIDNSQFKNYYSYSSSSKINYDGNNTYEEYIINKNNNGKKYRKHKIINTDKDGNQIIQNVPFTKKLI